MLTPLWNSENWPLQWGVVFGASLAAAVWDLKTRRIPNALALPLWISGLAWASYQGGALGFGDALTGSVLMAFPYVLLFVFASGGAGDAKFMGAIGAWLGILNGVATLAAVSLMGVILALVFAVARKQARAVTANVVVSFWVWIVGIFSSSWPRGMAAERGSSTRAGGTMPYGLAIFAGVCAAGVGVLVCRHPL